MSIIDALKSRIKEELSTGLPFMVGRENGALVFDTELTLKEFGFLTDHKNGGEYTVFTLEEDSQHFYFGGMVVTEKLRKIQNMFTEEELQVLKGEGLKVKFIKKKSQDKNKDNYTDMEII